LDALHDRGLKPKKMAFVGYRAHGLRQQLWSGRAFPHCDVNA